MKIKFMLFVLVSGVLSGSMHAATKSVGQTATVISVESREPQSNYAGTNPSDFPLSSEIHSYDITVRVGSTTYRTSYDSAFDYLPSVFVANHPIRVDLRRRVMYVTLPDAEKVRLAIEGRSDVQDALHLARS